MDGIYAQNGGTTSHLRTIFKLGMIYPWTKRKLLDRSCFFYLRPMSDVIQDGGRWPYWKLTLDISREINAVNACVITQI